MSLVEDQLQNNLRQWIFKGVIMGNHHIELSSTLLFV